jgi:hypothetical protein
MPRTLPVLATFLLGLASAGTASAQSRDRVVPVVNRAPVLEAQILGTVHDETGVGVRGASVLALGGTLAIVRTDDRGRFDFRLPPGEYVLRASGEGYVSTYRESVRVGLDEPLRRNITLTRATPRPAVQLASVGSTGTAGPAIDPDLPDPVPSAGPDGRSQTATAWRLRHLPRTVLRDGTPVPEWESEAAVDDRSWLVDSIASESVRTAASFLGDTDFTGHIDFLTTGSLAAAGPSLPLEWPHGIAYVVLGAPVGSRGDWSVRGALTAGDLTSWTLVGEYRARADQPHVFRTGVSYSAQVLTSDPDSPLSLASPGSRRVGTAWLSDRWTLAPGLALDYGGKLDRYDYLLVPNLVSADVAMRVRIAPRTTLVARMAPHMIAPGADQFLPPASAGAWLPPERTFSPLDLDDALRPERVERYDLLFETRLGDADAPVLRAGRFREATADQIATIFGLDEASASGHYYIGSPGSVSAEGWLFGVSGPVSEHIHGSVDYRTVRADWTDTARRSALLLSAVPSLGRRSHEQSHDLTAALDAELPATSTAVSLAYRFNTAFSTSTLDLPGGAGRFAVEVRQQLPFQPLGKGELNLLVSARTLLRGVGDDGAYFDELLTVAPPLRITCGLQMKF